MPNVGTLNQQLLAVERYLALPASVRRDIGEDVLWGHIYHGVLSGVDNPSSTVLDCDFRQVVLTMRKAQMEVRTTKDPETKKDAIHNAIELERIVDKELTCQP